MSSNNELKLWNFNYSKVLIIIDYGFEELYQMDYDFGCWTEIIRKQSQKEQLERMNWLGADRCGIYHCLKQ